MHPRAHTNVSKIFNSLKSSSSFEIPDVVISVSLSLLSRALLHSVDLLNLSLSLYFLSPVPSRLYSRLHERCWVLLPANALSQH